jgi:hypothetical protein
MNWPLSKDVIVLDTTGLHEDFHQEAAKLAKKYNYNVVLLIFAFKKHSDYFTYR